jgi:hypothetical protein
MEIETSDLAFTDLRRSEVGVAREGERCQVLGACCPTIALNDEGGCTS